ncbi:integrase [Bradyrhizobium sp. GM5.1]
MTAHYAKVDVTCCCRSRSPGPEMRDAESILAKYVDQQRSLGFKFRVQQILLRGYVGFAEERGDRHIRSARVLAWAARAPSPEQRRNRLLTVRRFALAMHAENPRHQVPAADALGHAVVKRRPPYIYSADEIARLLRAAAALRPVGSIRPTLYVTLFGLLTATGMRIAEALALQIDDVTADGLVVRQTKFQEPAVAASRNSSAGARQISGRPAVADHHRSCSLRIGCRTVAALQHRATHLPATPR